MDACIVSDGDREVTLLPELGARLHRIRAFGHELLRTPADPEMHRDDPFFWGGYVMAPWCNRIEPGPTIVDGRTVAPRSNFPDGSAIHGQVYAGRWTRTGDGRLRIEAGGDGWPWRYEVTLAVRLEAGVIHLELGLVNLADAPMPAGLGLHPWWRRPTRVAIRGRGVYPDNLMTPAEPRPVAGRFDLRRPRPMPPDLDATWTRLDEPAVTLAWDGIGVEATMRAGASLGSRPARLVVVAASPSGVDAVAIEPETNAPQGLRRLLRDEPDALARLAPGEALRLRIALEIERRPIAAR